MITKVLRANEIEEAADILRGGGLVAFPTETVYGLGAMAFDTLAVAEIFLAKGRPEEKPISLLVPDASVLNQLCRDLPECVGALTERFWPGPLTLVLRKSGEILPIISAQGDTVGVRCPDHPVAFSLLRALGGPIAAPSANLSGEEAPTDARGVMQTLGGRIDAVIDGGPCQIGTASTVLDLTVSPPRILRQGTITREDLAGVLGRVDA